jgi:hypothetical protein
MEASIITRTALTLCSFWRCIRWMANAQDVNATTQDDAPYTCFTRGLACLVPVSDITVA